MTLRVKNNGDIDRIKGLREKLSIEGIKLSGYSKYGNQGTYINENDNGKSRKIFFQSRKEAEFYLLAISWQKNGYIQTIQRQVKFCLHVKNEKGNYINYVADFSFININLPQFPKGICVIDVKSKFTRKIDLFQLKWALVKKIYLNFNFVVVE